MSEPLSKSIQEITIKELPLSCPQRGENAVKWHPRVYLPIEAEGHITCPYCGTQYLLKFSEQHAT